MPAPSDSVTSVPKRAPRRLKIKPWKVAPYFFISPFFIIFFIFSLFPLLFSIYLSFQRWDPSLGFAGMRWVGLENYTYTLQDDWFHRSLFNTFWLAIVSGVPQHVVAIPLAYFIHTSFRRWRNGVTALYFLPFITSTVAISLVFTSLFSRDYGVVNLVLTSIGDFSIGGIQPLGWLFPTERVDWGQPQYVKWQIAFVVWWRYVGWNTVLYLAALQTIPKDLFEAATMDGATKKQQFRFVTIPMLRPMMFFAVTLTIIGNLQLFEEPFILTGGNGGLDQAGKTAAMHMYMVAFVESDFGTASAVAWLLFILIASLTYANAKILGRKNQ